MPSVSDNGIDQPSPAPAISYTVTMHGHANNFNGGCLAWTGYSFWTTSNGGTPHVDQSGQVNFPIDDSITMAADSDSYRQGFVHVIATINCPFGSGDYGTGYVFWRTNAMLATASAPTSSNIAAYSATISCLYFPNTNASSATVKLQYRKQGDIPWIDAGSADVVSGYSQLSISRDLSGLLALTTYEFRLTMTRTTVNDTSLTSSVSTLTTSAGQPAITTRPATSISPTGAVLNGTVNPNGVSTTFWFDWGTTQGGPYPNSTAVQGPNSGTNPVDYNASLGGLLSPNTVYYFRAHALQGGVDYFGAEVSFSTDIQGHIMPTTYTFFGKYGVQQDFFFCVEYPSSYSSDRFYNGNTPWVAGDVKVDKDGAGLVNVANLPVRIGSTPLFKWTGTAGELSGARVNLLLVNLTSPPAWRDCHVAINTKLLLGLIDVDASAIGGNVHAMSLVGVGTGYGLFAKGSSGIRGEAQGTSGHGIAGVGIGPGQGVQGIGGASGQPSNFLDVVEPPEPFTAPANQETAMHILQYLKRRYTNKVTQDSGKQIWYKDDSTTVMTQRTVSDDLVTQVQNKLF